jgi:hypothetical protein
MITGLPKSSTLARRDHSLSSLHPIAYTASLVRPTHSESELHTPEPLFSAGYPSSGAANAQQLRRVADRPLLSTRGPRLQHLRGCCGASPLGSCRPFPGSPQCLRISACAQRFGYLEVSRYRAYSCESHRTTLSSPYFASAFVDTSGISPEQLYSGRRSLTLVFRLRLRGTNLPTSYSRYSSVRGHLMGPSWTKRSSSPGKCTHRMRLPRWTLLYVPARLHLAVPAPGRGRFRSLPRHDR